MDARASVVSWPDAVMALARVVLTVLFPSGRGVFCRAGLSFPSPMFEFLRMAAAREICRAFCAIVSEVRGGFLAVDLMLAAVMVWSLMRRDAARGSTKSIQAAKGSTDNQFRQAERAGLD